MKFWNSLIHQFYYLFCVFHSIFNLSLIDRSFRWIVFFILCSVLLHKMHHVFIHRSGLMNFCAVALALNEQGYKAVGIRIDSGDLAYLSCMARQMFDIVAEKFNIRWFSKLQIVASNDINEETIMSLNEQGHKIDCFGIGTHLGKYILKSWESIYWKINFISAFWFCFSGILVTCQRQPALGCVYKLVEINGKARIKLSQDVEKVTMPGNKLAYRLYGRNGDPLNDLLQKEDEQPPEVGTKVLCRHPFDEKKRAYVTPTRVEPLYKVNSHTPLNGFFIIECIWIINEMQPLRLDNFAVNRQAVTYYLILIWLLLLSSTQIYWRNGVLCQPIATLEQVKKRVQSSMESLRNDHKRTLNPTPYKVSALQCVHQFHWNRINKVKKSFS